MAETCPVVAVDLPGGPEFVDAVRRVWDDGGAVAPLPADGPSPYVVGLWDAVRPTHEWREGRAVARSGGVPGLSGDGLVIATSGTSGSPRAVVLTHSALGWAARLSSDALSTGRPVRWLACLPLHHIGGFSVVARSLLSGREPVVHPLFDAVAVEEAGREGCTHVSLVSAALARIDTTVFDRILLGGSAPPAHRPPNTVSTYGSTETGAGVVYDGRPLPGVDISVAGDGDEGEILVRSPTLARATRTDDPDGRPLTGPDGWYPTGDTGHWDGLRGVLEVSGRIDDVIVTGGHKVWPSPVEEVLMGHPQVAEAAIVARPDPEWGSAVTAVVVPVDPADPPELIDLRNIVRAVLPAWCAPHGLEIVTGLPRTSLGKLRRRSLAAPASGNRPLG